MDYSIYIRTLGKGGPKYQALLNSIDKQTIRPKDVFVVLPYGYNEPKEKLGYEHFVYCEKGMLKQRIFAIDHAETKWVLLLDDDVEFEPTLIEKYKKAILDSKADVAISPLLMEVPLTARNLYLALLSEQTIHFGNRDYYIKVNRAGGYSILHRVSDYNNYLTESGHGSHCFARVSALRDIHFEDELWLEDYGYALPEDQIFFYKLNLLGYKIVVCGNTHFSHLDAKSTGKKARRDGLMIAKSRNYIIFWKKFIRGQHHSFADRVLDIMAIVYRITLEFILYAIPSCIVDRRLGELRSYVKGIILGIRY